MLYIDVGVVVTGRKHLSKLIKLDFRGLRYTEYHCTSNKK